ncbi:MAG: metallophosphoesterase, partial [Planctomycetes bacterium]|nr:metallophosphoesterase [Planctomycetota bacterium]
MGPVVVRHLDVPIAGWPPHRDSLRIAHLSDLHLRTWDRRLEHTRELLLGLQYDLLAVTGDFCNHADEWPRAAELSRRLFASVHVPGGSFAVLGNHDDPRLADESGLNLQFLRDRQVLVNRGETVWAIAGIEQTQGRRVSLESALNGHDRDTPVVLLAHYPSAVYDVPAGTVELVLAGHTHGGQIRLPLLGCVWTNDRVPGRLARGLHRVGGTRLHVSPGIGVSGPIPWRWRCPPEITILRLGAPVADNRRNGAA